MDLGKVIFCSISNTKTKLILQSYINTNGNANDNDNGNENVNVNVNVNDSSSSSSSIESLAHLCLEHTPPFHAHYSHTANSRTFAFLVDSDLTFFAIAAATDHDPIALLYQIRDRATLQQHFDLGDIIARDHGLTAGAEQQRSGPSSVSSSTKAPLLDRREVGVGVGVGVEVDVECSASASASANAAELQMNKRRSKEWWRHVKVVMVVDLFLCVILFAIWMAVCRGFHCLS